MADSLDDRSAAAARPGVSFPEQKAAGVSYEERLAGDPRWAMSEGSRFFEGKGAVHAALQKITSRLEELGIPYAVAGGMALFSHGFRRFTEDVDILVTRKGSKQIHDTLVGLGYLPKFPGSKNLKDTELGVSIEFLFAGGYPGDDKPKDVAFPDPATVAERREDVNYVRLSTLIELKLASGMTNPERMKDLADVQELIKILGLASDFAGQLNPYVQEKYAELWKSVHEAPRRYLMLWRNKFLTTEATSFDEMVDSLKRATATLEAMLADGVTLDPNGGAADDYALLVTTDPDIAKKYDMHDESEFWGPDEPSSGEQDGVISG